jgi:hypothetical protein
MSYRPQFPYPTPEGYIDEEFTQYFDQFSVPALGTALAPAESVFGIPLHLEPGIEYRIRAVEVSAAAEDPLGIRFTDPWGNHLSDGFVPVASYNGNQGSQPGGIPVALESEIVCPPGGIVTVDLKNLS